MKLYELLNFEELAYLAEARGCLSITYMSNEQIDYLNTFYQNKLDPSSTPTGTSFGEISELAWLVKFVEEDELLENIKNRPAFLKEYVIKEMSKYVSSAI